MEKCSLVEFEVLVKGQSKLLMYSVPSSWVSKVQDTYYCRWPDAADDKKVKRYAKSYVTPEPTWDTDKCKLVLAEVDNYDKCEEKLLKILSAPESDIAEAALTTDDEKAQIRKKSRHERNKRLLSSDDEDAANEKQAKSAKTKRSKTKQNEDEVLRQLQQSKIALTSLKEKTQSSAHTKANTPKMIQHESANEAPNAEADEQGEIMSRYKSPSASASSRCDNALVVSSAIAMTSTPSSSARSTSTVSYSQIQSLHSQPEKRLVQRDLIIQPLPSKQLGKMSTEEASRPVTKGEFFGLCGKMMLTMIGMQKTLDSIAGNETNLRLAGESMEWPLGTRWALKTLKDFFDQESQLADESTAANLIRWIQQECYDSNYGRMVRQTLRAMLDPNLQQEFVFSEIAKQSGVKFETTRIYKLIFRAVRKGNKVKRDRLRKCFQSWFQHKSDRKEENKKVKLSLVQKKATKRALSPVSTSNDSGSDCDSNPEAECDD